MEVRVQRGLIAQRLGTVVGDGQRHGQLLADFDVVDAWNRGEAPECSWASSSGVASASDSVYRMRRSSVASSSTCQTVVRANPCFGFLPAISPCSKPSANHGSTTARLRGSVCPDRRPWLPYGGMAARGRPGEHVSAEIADLRGTVFIGDVANSKRSNHRSQYMPMSAFENTYLGHSCFYIKCLNTFEHFMMKYRDSEK